MTLSNKNPFTEIPPQGAEDVQDNIPKIPDEHTNKFPELKEFNRQLDDFWHNVKLILQRKDDRITTLENEKVSLDERITALEELHP